MLIVWVQWRSGRPTGRSKMDFFLPGGGQKSVGLVDFFGFLPSYLHGRYDLRNTHPYLHGHGFGSRHTTPPKANLPLPHTHTHARMIARTHIRAHDRARTHAHTYTFMTYSLSLRLTPSPSKHATKPTYIFFCPLIN